MVTSTLIDSNVFIELYEYSGCIALLELENDTAGFSLLWRSK